MAEEIRNGKKPGTIGSIFIFLGVLLIMAVVYVSAILLQMPEEDQAASAGANGPEAVTRMQPAEMNNAQALADLFGAPLPYLPGYVMSGQGSNADYEGAVARVAVLQYGGVTVSAVRPASAAPLLLHDELSVSMRSDLSFLNLPAVLAEKGGARCVYLSGPDAAYSVYAPQAGEQEFLDLLNGLEWTE